MKSQIKTRPKRDKQLSISPSRSPVRNMGSDSEILKSKRYAQITEQDKLQNEILKRFQYEKVPKPNRYNSNNQLQNQTEKRVLKKQSPQRQNTSNKLLEQYPSHTPTPILDTPVRNISVDDLKSNFDNQSTDFRLMQKNIINQVDSSSNIIRQDQQLQIQTLKNQVEEQLATQKQNIQQIYISQQTIQLLQEENTKHKLLISSINQTKPLQIQIGIQAQVVLLTNIVQTDNIEIISVQSGYQVSQRNKIKLCEQSIQTVQLYEPQNANLHNLNNDLLLNEINSTQVQLDQSRLCNTRLQQQTLQTNLDLQQIDYNINQVQDKFASEKNLLHVQLQQNLAEISQLQNQINIQCKQIENQNIKLQKLQQFKINAFNRITEFYEIIGVESQQKFSNLNNLARQICIWRDFEHQTLVKTQRESSQVKQVELKLQQNQQDSQKINFELQQTMEVVHQKHQQLSQLQIQYEIQKQLLLQVQTQLKEKESENSNQNSQIQELQQQIINKQFQLTKLQGQYTTDICQFQEQIQTTNKNLTEVEHQLKSKSNTCIELQNQYTKISNQGIQEFQILQKQISQLQENYNIKCLQVKNLETSTRVIHKVKPDIPNEQLQDDLLAARQQIQSLKQQITYNDNSFTMNLRIISAENIQYKTFMSEICQKYNIVQEQEIVKEYIFSMLTQQDVNELKQAYNSELQSKTSTINNLEIEINCLQKSLDILKNEITQTKQKNKELGIQIVDGTCLENEIDEQEKKIVMLQLQIQNLTTDKQELQEKARQQIIKIQKKDDIIHSLEYQLKLIQEQQEVNQSQEQLNNQQQIHTLDQSQFQEISQLGQRLLIKEKLITELSSKCDSVTRQYNSVLTQNQEFEIQVKSLKEENYELNQKLQKQLILTTNTASDNITLQNTIEYQLQNQEILNLENKVLGQKSLEFLNNVLQTQSEQIKELDSSQIIAYENQQQVISYKTIMLETEKLLICSKKENQQLQDELSDKNLSIQRLKFTLEELQTNNKQLRTQLNLLNKDIDNSLLQQSDLNRIIQELTTQIHQKDYETTQIVNQLDLNNNLITELNEQVFKLNNYKQSVEMHQTDLHDLLELLSQKEILIQKLQK
ncbi:hypothetical protein SS50377_20961 [Spironucleus salmonicida]|uniref:Uncharacterized protein n=1 Tax=Spironucleus salmonicida TaxID=348837 RepID=V6LIS7_9EUKA|nr:hypothetical protein SS50377_20961 [Spironucleus salmonicida]|eukprot:EST43631.1 hypothetical protein SS50377_16674 [Spironucleus salmonicida]